MYSIKPETTALTAQIEPMLDAVFGPDRFTKASYRFRENVAPVDALSYVACDDDDRVIGSIRYWPVLVGPEQHRALLLGPLAIATEHAGRGLGRELVFRTLEVAADLGHDLVILVGDPDYYKRFGFVPATPLGFVMPGESRPHRLQIAALRDGVIGRVSGEVLPDCHRCDDADDTGHFPHQASVTSLFGDLRAAG